MHLCGWTMSCCPSGSWFVAESSPTLKHIYLPRHRGYLVILFPVHGDDGTLFLDLKHGLFWVSGQVELGMAGVNEMSLYRSLFFSWHH